MWKPYKEMSEIFFKNASFVVDKYHWIRQGIWAFESIRKGEQKKFSISERKYFKKSKSLLIKRFEFLSDEDKQVVNIMLYKNRNIRIAHDLKEDFLEAIKSSDRKEAEEKISSWIKYAELSGLGAFRIFV